MVTAAAAGAAAVAGLGAAAINAAAGFEQGLSNISAVSGATAAEMGQISDLALRLGKDTSFSASQAAAGIEELIKGGVGVADVMDGAADATLNLAAAGGVDLATAAEISANALAMFNLKGSDMAMVADQIAGAANASSLSVTDFKFSIAAAGSVMAASSQSIESTATAIALMGQAGIKGSDAGTSLKAAFNNLIPTTDKATAKMKELGIITADGVNQFLNLDGSFRQTGEIAQVLQSSLAGLSDSQRTLALETIFGSDGMRAGIVLAKAGAEGFDAMAASMGKVTAASVGAMRLDNLRGDMEQLSGSLETAGITLGTVFLPALRDLAQAATAVVNKTIPLLDVYGPRFVASLGSTATFIGDNLVPALSAVSAATLTYGVTSLPAMSASLTKAIPLLYAKGAALTASLGPFALVAGAAFLAAKAYDAWSDGIQATVDKQLASNEALQRVIALQEEVRQSTDLQTPAIQRQNAEIDVQIQKYNDLAVDLQKRLELEAAGIRSQERTASAIGEARAALEAQQGVLAESENKLKTLVQWQETLAYTQSRVADEGSAYVDYINSATVAYSGAAQSVNALGTAATLTDDEIKKVNDELAKTAQEGATAFGAVVTAYQSFQSDVESTATAHWATLATLHQEWANATTDQERTAIQQRIDAETTGFATSQQNAAAAYAEQQAANRANLGQMLIDTVNGWQVLGTVPAEMADTLRLGIAEHFGVANDEMGLQFGKLLGVIQGVADGTGVAAGQMGGEFAKIEAAAATSATNTAANQQRMVADLTADYNAGKLSFQQYQDALTRIPTEINTVVTHNAVDARQRFIDFKLAQAEIRANTVANITSNAAEIAGQVRNVTAALNLIPSVKTVHIQARVDEMLQRHSPSPIEQVMAAIEAFANKRHVLTIDTAGLDISGGFAGAPETLGGKVRQSVESVQVHLSKLISSLQDTAGKIRQPAEAVNTHLRKVIESIANTSKDSRVPVDEATARLQKITGAVESTDKGLRGPTENVEAHLRKVVASLQDSAGKIKQPADAVEAHLRKIVESIRGASADIQLTAPTILDPLATGVENGKVRTSVENVEAHLRKLIASLQETGDKARQPAEAVEAHLRKVVESIANTSKDARIPAEAVEAHLRKIVASLQETGDKAKQPAEAVESHFRKVVDAIASTSKDARIPADAVEAHLRKVVASLDSTEKGAKVSVEQVEAHLRKVIASLQTTATDVALIAPTMMVPLGAALDTAEKNARQPVAGVEKHLRAVLASIRSSATDISLTAPTMMQPLDAGLRAGTTALLTDGVAMVGEMDRIVDGWNAAIDRIRVPDFKIGAGGKSGGAAAPYVPSAPIDLGSGMSSVGRSLSGGDEYTPPAPPWIDDGQAGYRAEVARVWADLRLGYQLADAATRGPRQQVIDLNNAASEAASKYAAAVRASSDSASDLEAAMRRAQDAATAAIASVGQKTLDNLAKLGSTFGSIGSSAANYGLKSVNDRMTALSAELKSLESIAPYAQGLDLDTRRLGLLDEQAAAQSEQVALQQKLIGLQDRQNKLGYLQEQMKLLDLIDQYKLNSADILNGVDLGLGASAGGLADAMTRAMDAILFQMDKRLSTTTMPNLLTMPNLTPVYRAPAANGGSGPSTIDNSIVFEEGAITVVAGPGQNARELAEQLMPEIDRILRQRRGS